MANWDHVCSLSESQLIRDSGFGTTSNGRVHSEFEDPVQDTARSLIERRLGLMDGVNRFAWCLWKTPPGIEFDDIDLRNWPIEYLQAGGSRDSMTLEFRTAEDGYPRQYRLGHEGTMARASREEVVVRWDRHSISIRSDQVFSATEAADVFLNYYELGTVSDKLSRELLDL